MNMQKRECGIKMRIVPYGAGWTDVYMDFGTGELYFIISNCVGDNFTDFMRLLYHMFPQENEPECCDDRMEYKYAVCRRTENGYETEYIVEDARDIELNAVYHEVPWKAEFVWDGEGASSIWHMEREANEETDFVMSVDVKLCRGEERSYHFNVSYRDLCYAFAKAYTEMIKKHGFIGYHHAVYSEDIHMRYFLFLKAYALDCLDMIELTYYEEKGEGERTSLKNELELLLFDM